jgi:hypothetical protein
MIALEKGSLFSDTLQKAWRQQLELYEIASFYEEDEKASCVAQPLGLLPIAYRSFRLYRETMLS